MNSRLKNGKTASNLNTAVIPVFRSAEARDGPTLHSLELQLLSRWPFRRSFWINEIVIRIVLAVVAVCFREFVPLTVREVLQGWQSYGFPHKAPMAEIWPSMVWIPIVTLVPALISVATLVIISYSCKHPHQRVWVSFFFFALTHTFVLVVVVAFTEFIKNIYGQLRPDYLARCFEENNPAVWMAAHNWTSWDQIPAVPTCTRPPSTSDLVDGRRSFPSGHASVSWASLTHLALWMTWQLGAFPPIGTWRLIPGLACLLWATEITISRCQDNVHHPVDVIAGAFLGFFIALFTYQYYYGSWNVLLNVGQATIAKTSHRRLTSSSVKRQRTTADDEEKPPLIESPPPPEFWFSSTPQAIAHEVP